MKSILVVCEGNICRSPMAAGLLAKELPAAQVRSAGLGALVGMPADDIAVRLMHAQGVDISSHRAAQLTRAACMDAELVLVMSASQRQRIEQDYPFACGRVFRICEFSKQDVPDPYGQDEHAFRVALRLIDQGVSEWMKRLHKILSTT